jgi:hypothetical protein
VTEQLPPDVIAQLTGMDPAITPELIATSWSLLKPFHDKVGYQAPKIDRDLRYGAHRGDLEVAYFGPRPSAEVSTLPGLLASEVPLVFAVAERDPWFSQGQVASLTAAWYAAKGELPHVIYSAGHNHISQIGSVGVDDLAMGAQLARFVNRVTGEV